MLLFKTFTVNFFFFFFFSFIYLLFIYLFQFLKFRNNKVKKKDRKLGNSAGPYVIPGNKEVKVLLCVGESVRPQANYCIRIIISDFSFIWFSANHFIKSCKNENVSLNDQNKYKRSEGAMGRLTSKQVKAFSGQECKDLLA